MGNNFGRKCLDIFFSLRILIHCGEMYKICASRSRSPYPYDLVFFIYELTPVPSGGWFQKLFPFKKIWGLKWRLRFFPIYVIWKIFFLKSSVVKPFVHCLRFTWNCSVEYKTDKWEVLINVDNWNRHGIEIVCYQYSILNNSFSTEFHMFFDSDRVRTENSVEYGQMRAHFWDDSNLCSNSQLSPTDIAKRSDPLLLFSYVLTNWKIQ